MLGQELTALFSADGQYQVTAWDKDGVDITNFSVLEERLAILAPAIVINAVAYNAVDQCETDDEEYRQALTLNRDVPAFLAEMSSKLGFTLVHYSTDYVFDGTLAESLLKTGCCGGGCCGSGSRGEIGYNEEAIPNPISRYGESKHLGECRVREKAKAYYLIRLSKLFGNPGSSPLAKKSFFETMLERAKGGQGVEGVNEEKSAFTYAPDLAQATKELIESGDDFGVYHLTNTGSATWYDATLALYRLAGVKVSVMPILGDKFPRAAKRPTCSTLINSKRPALRSYEEALTDYLRNPKGV